MNEQYFHNGGVDEEAERQRPPTAKSQKGWSTCVRTHTHTCVGVRGHIYALHAHARRKDAFAASPHVKWTCIRTRMFC
jgi:hypothetical protein